MKVIYLERGKGKTTELIKICDKTGYYIVCPTQRQCGMIFQMAKEMGCNINFPMTYQEFVDKQYGPFVKGILIDNVDMLLQRMSRVPIIAVSITKDEGFCKVDCPDESGYPCVKIEDCRKKAEMNK